VCTLAIQTSASRMIFSMGRDKVLPFSSQLAKVSTRTGTPLLSTVIAGVGAALLLVVNIGNPALFLGLSSVCIMLMYVAYLLVTGPMLVRRLRGQWEIGPDDETGRPGFSMGSRLGLVVNAVAVLYGVAMAINLGWPRAEVFDPTGGHWYLQFLGPIVLGVTLLAGLVAYRVQRHDYHAAIRAKAPVTTVVPALPAAGLAGLAGEEA
jgi:amino acid transporter